MLLTQDNSIKVFKNSQTGSDFSMRDFKGNKRGRVSYRDVVSRCRTYFNEKAGNLYNEVRDHKERKALAENIIIQFLAEEDYKDSVIGFTGEDGDEGYSELKESLINEMVNLGALTRLYYAPPDEIGEIQVKGPKAIFYEQEGKWKQEKVDVFESVEELNRVVDKLKFWCNVRLNYTNPVANARTPEDYRINMTSPAINVEGFPNLTIRKTTDRDFTEKELVEDYKTLSWNMIRLIKMLPNTKTSWMVVGETGSGKTTLNRFILRQTPMLKPLITVENPSEMNLQSYDKSTGLAQRMVSQFELDLNIMPGYTMSNAVEEGLRQTPELFLPGEIRSAQEVYQFIRGLMTGHQGGTSFHSKGGMDAISRLSLEYAAATGLSQREAASSISQVVKIIIYQAKLKDGKRKVLSIDEVSGYDDKTGLPKINQLFKFKQTDTKYTEEGLVDEIIGHHVQVNPISTQLKEDLQLEGGYSDKYLSFLTDEERVRAPEQYKIELSNKL